MNPRVSVLTTVHNGEAHIDKCVKSILSQSLKDFEYIIINNGSTDGTAEILNGYTDPRLRIFHQDNQGITKALIRGVGLATCDLIARLDADDYALPEKLIKQVEFMEGHPDYVICGSRFYELMGNENYEQRVPFVQGDTQIRKALSCYNPFGNSTVMFRKSAYLKVGGYSKKSIFSQDFDLWVRLMEKGKGFILEDTLTVIHIHAASSSFKNFRKQKMEGLLVRWNAFLKFGGNPLEAMFFFLKTLLSFFLPAHRGIK